MNAEATAARLAASYEGFRGQAYQDGGGVWTVGYGTTRLDGRPVVRGDSLTPEAALALLTSYLARDSVAIRKAAGPATENQIAAFLDLAYNVGLKGVLDSTAMRCHKAKDRVGAAKGILMWIKDNGVEVPGLMRRRCADAELYLTP